MPNFSSLEAAYYLLALTVPAVVFMYVRIQFTHGRMPKASEAVLHYIAITAIYYSLALPFILLAMETPGTWLTRWLGWLAVAFIVPGAMGLASGWAAQSNFLYNAMRRLGLNLIHSAPTAWEWRVGNCPEWIVVTLKNGNAYGAYCGKDSFVSTEPGERDIYLERTYDIGPDGKWTERAFGMLICSGELSTIEFSIIESSEPHDQASFETSATHAD